MFLMTESTSNSVSSIRINEKLKHFVLMSFWESKKKPKTSTKLILEEHKIPVCVSSPNGKAKIHQVLFNEL